MFSENIYISQEYVQKFLHKITKVFHWLARSSWRLTLRVIGIEVDPLAALRKLPCLVVIMMIENVLKSWWGWIGFDRWMVVVDSLLDLLDSILWTIVDADNLLDFNDGFEWLWWKMNLLKFFPTASLTLSSTCIWSQVYLLYLIILVITWWSPPSSSWSCSPLSSPVWDLADCPTFADFPETLLLRAWTA